MVSFCIIAIHMLLKTQGILLRTTKYSETSIIAKIYTRAIGLHSYMIKGVRGEKSKNKAALFQPGNIFDLEVYNQKNKTLHYVKEYKLHNYYRNIGTNMLRIGQMMFMLELVNHAIKEEEPNEELFDFLADAFYELDSEEETDLNFHLKFMLRLSRHLGFYPTDNFSEKNTVFDIQEGCFFKELPANRLSINMPQSFWLHEILCGRNPDNIFNEGRNILLQQLLEYYKTHIEHFPNLQSHKILHEILQG